MLSDTTNKSNINYGRCCLSKINNVCILIFVIILMVMLYFYDNIYGKSDQSINNGYILFSNNDFDSLI